ncbi:MAG: diaminopimelate epimerase [Bacteroidota bacterium]
MEIPFFKFHGAMNDFVVLDGRNTAIPELTIELVQLLCNRRSGIGADGVILLKEQPNGLRMVYFNSDGKEGSMCGNGGRCFAAFARMLGLAGEQVDFEAYDGPHRAFVLSSHNNHYTVQLEMTDVTGVEKLKDCMVLDTGSPHYITFVDDLDAVDVFNAGKSVRYSERFAKDGINVNFVQPTSEALHIRTYERGVEAETMACGTGSVAAAIAAYESGLVSSNNNIIIHTRGGQLQVSFDKKDGAYHQVTLTGPAEFVFKGFFQYDGV